MNRQTRRLHNAGKSLKFNHGVDFSHLSGRERAAHPEFTIVDTADNPPRRRRPHTYNPTGPSISDQFRAYHGQAA